MCIYDEFPEFSRISPDKLREIIRQTPLSRQDRQIAIYRLIEFRYYVEIAAELNSNRTTVSYRMRKIIAPALRKHIS